MCELRELLSFSAPVAYALSMRPQALATADVNGDGKSDLISLFSVPTVAAQFLNGPPFLPLQKGHRP